MLAVIWFCCGLCCRFVPTWLSIAQNPCVPTPADELVLLDCGEAALKFSPDSYASPFGPNSAIPFRMATLKCLRPSHGAPMSVTYMLHYLRIL
ncbi:hypothetical protein PILCRDRAFT_652478 [Piloderma croceum F 1598]|uniref:Secreted protein n=1 Tax=Piloderma croceum (strain F 1598) TaxID=765440 RepID=A0A0C3EUL0_PILCF|nr:hypothetical protein PILCRDRAFT_652478 [Piloderma croceum F 1598]